MLPTVLGGIVVALGVLCQYGHIRYAVITLFALSVFGASSAIDLPALGGASIAPANLFILFYGLRFAREPNALASLYKEIEPRRPLFIFLLLLLWIIVSALLLPRLFEGKTEVFTLSRSVDSDGDLVMLHPAGGNISQAVYAIGGFGAALLTAAYVRRLEPAAVVSAILVTTGIHLFFAAADLATSATGTGFLLEPIHNGGYSFLTEDELGGLKRISGSFSEASSFATFSITLLAANFTLFMYDVRRRLTGAFSVALIFCLLLATSSAGYVGLLALVLLFVVHALASAARGSPHALRMGIVLFVLVLSVVSVAEIFFPAMADLAQTVIDQSLLSKSTSVSAMERGAMNEQSWRVFLDTDGLGAGIGSERASNYALMLLANLGIPGLLLFVVLLSSLLGFKPPADAAPGSSAITAAARLGIAATLIPSLMVGTVYDLGTIFYCMVGVAAAGMLNIATVPVALKITNTSKRQSGCQVPATPER